MSKSRLKSCLLTIILCLLVLGLLKERKNQEILDKTSPQTLTSINNDYDDQTEPNNFPKQIDPICQNVTYNKTKKRKIDPRKLDFVINPINLCLKKSPLLFIYVFSKVKSFEKRQIIRQTWANKELVTDFVHLAFILGLSNENHTNQRVNTESEITGDIIQGNFHDSLRNLSIKSITAWKWITSHCKQTRYVLKLDDDTIPNMIYVLNFIKYLNENHFNLRNSYFCEVLKNVSPDRNFNRMGKYATSCEEYDRLYFKDYCCGQANIITSDLIPILYKSTFKAKEFWVDDVYVGFITNSLNIKMYDISKVYIKNNEKSKRITENFLYITENNDNRFMLRNWEIIKYKNKLIKKSVLKEYWKNFI